MDDTDVETLYLRPPILASSSSLAKNNQTILSTFNPSTNSIACSLASTSTSTSNNRKGKQVSLVLNFARHGDIDIAIK